MEGTAEPTNKGFSYNKAVASTVDKNSVYEGAGDTPIHSSHVGVMGNSTSIPISGFTTLL